MSLIESSTSSNVANNSKKQYDVFLSFRGEDTRYGITGYLYKALRDKKIETYMDEKSLGRGNEISQSLLAAIERSKISVIVFSERYATSSWCLSELVHIHKCRRNFNQFVLPIFYKIDPSNIRKQDEGSYRDAFVDHERNSEHSANTIQEWRDALRASSDLSGLHYPPTNNRYESELVDEVVEIVTSELRESNCDQCCEKKQCCEADECCEALLSCEENLCEEQYNISGLHKTKYICEKLLRRMKKIQLTFAIKNLDYSILLKVKQ